MILRRFVKHMHDQNWFAVGLDVLVVIAGIFLGMQVTDWNEDRKTANSHRIYLDSLVDDIDQALVNLHRVRSNYEIKLRRTFAVVRVLKGEMSPDEAGEAFEMGLRTAPHLYQLELHIGALGQLLDGRAPETGNTSLQRSLVDLQNAINAQLRTIEHINIRLDAQLPVLDSMAAPPVASADDGLDILYDLPAMKASRHYAITMQNIADTSENTLGRLETIEDLLVTFQGGLKTRPDN